MVNGAGFGITRLKTTRRMNSSALVKPETASRLIAFGVALLLAAPIVLATAGILVSDSNIWVFALGLFVAAVLICAVALTARDFSNSLVRFAFFGLVFLLVRFFCVEFWVGGLSWTSPAMTVAGQAVAVLLAAIGFSNRYFNKYRDTYLVDASVLGFMWFVLGALASQYFSGVLWLIEMITPMVVLGSAFILSRADARGVESLGKRGFNVGRAVFLALALWVIRIFLLEAEGSVEQLYFRAALRARRGPWIRPDIWLRLLSRHSHELMPLVVVLSTMLFAWLFFRGVSTGFLKTGILLGLTLMAVNAALDALVMHGAPFIGTHLIRTDFYMSHIPLYALFPIIAIDVGYLESKARAQSHIPET